MPRRVEIVADLVCVHGYLRFTRFLRAAGRYRDAGGEVETVFRPYQLRPDGPAAGEPLFEEHKRDRGEAFARAVAADTTIGVADGLELSFGRAVFPHTFDAHLLLSRASARGRGEAMAERLFRAYFTDGLHIADGDTLRRPAAEVGVAAAAGEEEAADRPGCVPSSPGCGRGGCRRCRPSASRAAPSWWARRTGPMRRSAGHWRGEGACGRPVLTSRGGRSGVSSRAW